MPTTLMRSAWLFPPATREVQFDEKWAFVGKKQKNCDPADPADAQCGDYWDFVAFDPEHRLVLAVIPGARSIENEEVHQRLGGTAPILITSDELPAYATAIETTFSEPVAPPAQRGPGRPRVVPVRSLPKGLCYATVHKEREHGRVVAVTQQQVYGTAAALEEALGRSSASHTVNTSFVERHHGTDRCRNARKARRTYRFSKDWEVHEAMTYFTMYSYNFCWAVRTLRVRREEGGWQTRTPAMSAGLADHIWSLEEWLTFPVFQST
jgi:IS1 family transposase